MASNIDFVDHVIEQVQGLADITCKKMFGEYLVYASGRPAILICDNTAFVKINDATSPFLEDVPRGYPYEGSKQHYIVDVDDRATLARVVDAIAKTPLPAPHAHKKAKGKPRGLPKKTMKDFPPT
jgi:TfoX/Sxy family transcriptional regulator of competence genes